MRFSKGIHPEMVVPAAERAAELMHEHAGGVVAGAWRTPIRAKLPPQVIELTLGEISRLLGIDIPVAEVERILTALDFKVEPKGSDGLRSPCRRTGSTSRPARPT